MKKLLLLLICTLLGMQIASAQSKTVLAVLPFKSDYNAGTYADQQSIMELVTQAFVATGRFNIYDNNRIRLGFGDSIPENVNLSDIGSPALIQIGKTLGIEYFILGNVKNVSAKATTDLTNKTAYTGHVIFSLKLINVNTGEIGEVKTFDSYGAIGGYVNMTYETDQTAILKAIQSMKRPVTKFIEDNFPILFRIIDITEKKGGEALVVQMLGGESMGLEKNDKLTVIQLTTITVDGKQLIRRKVIGAVKVTEVQGDDISEAKVTDGGEAILKAFETDPKSLVCKTD